MNSAHAWLAALALAMLAATPALSGKPPTSTSTPANQEAGTEKIDPRLHEIHPDEMIDVGIESDANAGRDQSEPVGPGRLPAQEPRDEPQANPRIQNTHDSAYDTPGTNPGAYSDAPDQEDE